jgi:DHA1 family inner membrane transport protein
MRFVNVSSFPVLTPKRERLLLIVLALVQFAHIVDFMILMPLGPRLMSEFGISPAHFGALVSAYTFSAGICGFLAAPLLDRFTRKTALMCSFGGFIVGTTLCGFATNYEWLMLARVVAGCFGGVSNALIVATVADAVPLERRGAAMGIVMMSFGLASVLGVPLGLIAANPLGWRAPFLILGALSLVLLSMAAIALPHVARSGRAAGESVLESLRAVFGVRGHWTAFAFTAVLMFAGFVMIPYISPTLVKNCGLSNEQLPYVYVLGGACTFVSMPLLGRLADKFGLFRIFAIMSVLTIPVMLAVTHFGRLPLGYILPVTTAFMICASGRIAPAMTLVTSAVEPKHRGGFLSVNNSFQQIAIGLGAMTGALIVTSGPGGTLLHYGRAGWVGIAAILLSVFLASRIRKTPQA